jgi:cysteine desulfurase/selenocysteine lyase
MPDSGQLVHESDAGVSPDGGALTALIVQLSKEHSSGQGKSLPVSEVASPGAFDSFPSSYPLPKPTTPVKTTPVHPTFDPLDQNAAAPKNGKPASALDPGSSTDGYAFDEPHRYFDRRDLTSGGYDAAPVASYEGPEYYFLPKSQNKATASPAGLAPLTGALPIQAGFDVESIRRDFPALNQKVNGKPLVWLDNAATTHKPQSVIDATSSFYSRDNSNIHRAAYVLAERSTKLFEGARQKISDFIGSPSPKNIVFLRGTTEAINLVAQSYGRQNIGAGDEIILSTIEHHANIVPWQLLAQQTGAVIRVIPVNDRGEIILEQFISLLNGRTKLVSIGHVANSLGTIAPVEQIISLAHSFGVPVLVDAAQSAPHIPLNVSALDADFLVLSGHKVFGPTGIGVLYGKSPLLESMPPWQGGGHMIKDVTFAKTTYQNAPEKFEAGTPDIAGAIGLGAAVDYLQSIGMPGIAAYEHSLLEYATPALLEVPGLKLIGTAVNKASVLSFIIDGVEPDKIASHLDKQGIAVRAGHHCALPALRRFGLEKTVRASLAFYNNHEDVDKLVYSLKNLPRS